MVNPSMPLNTLMGSFIKHHLKTAVFESHIKNEM